MIYLDENRREEAIEAGWLAYRERLPTSEAQYRAACEAWKVIAVVADRVIGALFCLNGVIHIGIIPTWRGRWASRRLIAQMLGHGKRTELMQDEAACASFIGRIGFKPGPDGFWEHKGGVCHS